MDVLKYQIGLLFSMSHLLSMSLILVNWLIYILGSKLVHGFYKTRKMGSVTLKY